MHRTNALSALSTGSIEQDLLDFVLGSGSSYMEAVTDRQHFCRYHFSENVRLRQYSGQCLDLKDPLPAHDPGNAAGICLLPPPEKALFWVNSKKSKAMKIPSACGSVQKRIPAISVPQYKDTYARYLDTFFYLWKNDENFRNKVINGKGFCLPHFGDLCEAADRKLSDKEKNRLLRSVAAGHGIQHAAHFRRRLLAGGKIRLSQTKTPTGRAPGMPSSAVCRN